MKKPKRTLIYGAGMLAVALSLGGCRMDRQNENVYGPPPGAAESGTEETENPGAEASEASSAEDPNEDVYGPPPGKEDPNEDVYGPPVGEWDESGEEELIPMNPAVYGPPEEMGDAPGGLNGKGN